MKRINAVLWNSWLMQSALAALQILHAYRTRFVVDGKDMLTAQALKLSKIANISTVFRPWKTMFIVTMQCILSYERAFQENYTMWYFDVRIIDIFESMMFLSSLALASKWPTYSISEWAMMMIRHEKERLLLVNLDWNALAAKTPGITSVNGSTAYSSCEENIIVLNPSAGALGNNDHRPATFYANAI